jgi:hypothetical protein
MCIDIGFSRGTRDTVLKVHNCRGARVDIRIDKVRCMNGISQKLVVEGAVEMTFIGAKSRKERSAQREVLSARRNGDKDRFHGAVFSEVGNKRNGQDRLTIWRGHDCDHSAQGGACEYFPEYAEPMQ